MTIKPIKLFEIVEGAYQWLGIRRSESKLKDRVSLKCYFLLLTMSTYITASLAFCMFEAKTVAEHCDTFYNASTGIMLIFQISTYIREVPKSRQLTKKFENFLQESKFD